MNKLTMVKGLLAGCLLLSGVTAATMPVGKHAVNVVCTGSDASTPTRKETLDTFYAVSGGMWVKKAMYNGKGYKLDSLGKINLLCENGTTKDITARSQKLFRQDLLNYLNGVDRKCVILSIAKLILAEYDNKYDDSKYNSLNFNETDIANLVDIIDTKMETFNHILTHGHLGYFPAFWCKSDDTSSSVSLMRPRGMFCISETVLKPIYDAQSKQIEAVMKLGASAICRYPNTSPIDIPQSYGTLDASQQLKKEVKQVVKGLFSDGAVSVDVGQGNSGRDGFVIDAEYGSFKGRDSRNQETKRVRFCIEVMNGVIVLKSIFPLDLPRYNP